MMGRPAIWAAPRRTAWWVLGIAAALGFTALGVHLAPSELRQGGRTRVPEPSGQSPELLTVRKVRTLPHDPEAFTQGLLLHQGRVYESTGLYGRSSLRRWDPETGEIELRVELPAGVFGEGLARVGDRLFQLTWKSGIAFVWDLETFEPVTRHHYTGEGWGLTFDGRHLVMSNGSATLTFRDPETFAVDRQLEVRREGKRQQFINELEYAEGAIWANIWTTEEIVRIDPESGEVTAVIDASPIVPRDPGVDVLNGVAYRPVSGTFYLTGKLWPSLFEVELVPPGPPAALNPRPSAP
jgi:glutaminyl-peptide cyclotransferase